MRAIVQRVHSASVQVDNAIVGKIDRGLVAFVGAARGDTESDADYIAHKISSLRVFPDEQDKMSRSVLDIDGGILAVSQFTLFGDVRRGRRPSFDAAMAPDEASKLFQYFVEQLRAHAKNVHTGVFRAMMTVQVANDGPVTIMLDSKKLF